MSSPLWAVRTGSNRSSVPAAVTLISSLSVESSTYCDA
jgi:hypothetical protein